MAPNMDAIELWVKVVLASNPVERDPGVYNLPLREVKLPEKLCFGIIMDDGIVKPTPAVTRALLESKAALEAAGHKVIEYTPYNTEEAGQLMLRLLAGDGGYKLDEQLCVPTPEMTEPWPVGLKPFEQLFNANKGKTPSVGSLWDAQAARSAYLIKLLDHWYASRDSTGTGRAFDGVISPVMAFPTAPRYKAEHFLYTGIWNMADFTSMAYPAGFTKATDVKTGKETLRNDMEKRIWDFCEYEVYHR